MKMRATLIWEYDLPENDLKEIKASEENGDPTDEFVEECEAEFYNNDPITFIEKRLLETDDMSPDIKREGIIHEGLRQDGLIGVVLAEHLEHVTSLKVQVVEHG